MWTRNIFVTLSGQSAFLFIFIMLFIGGTRVEASSDGKRSPLLIDIRNNIILTVALPAF